MTFTRAALVCAFLASPAGIARAAESDVLPVAAATIYPGQTITDTMLTDREYPGGTRADYPIFADRMQLIGKVARRTLVAGKLIPGNAVGEPDLVTRGSIVQATYRTPGIEISAPVVALQAGQLAAAIQVRNVSTGKVIIGVVQPDGSVLVGGGS